jgi:hypothetical protein
MLLIESAANDDGRTTDMPFLNQDRIRLTETDTSRRRYCLLTGLRVRCVRRIRQVGNGAVMAICAVLVCCLMPMMVVGAEVPNTPDGFWPMPIPAWMNDADAAYGPVLTHVQTDRPAYDAHMQIGDVVVACGGLHILAASEMSFAECVAASRADGHGAYRRNGVVTAVQMPTFAAFGRWRAQMRDAELTMPDSLGEDWRLTWRMMPVRVQAAILRQAQDGSRDWLPALLQACRAVGNGGMAPAAIAMPDPYLQRVFIWWNYCAAHRDAWAVSDDLEEAVFRAAHIVLPTDPPLAIGTIAVGIPEADRLLVGLATDPSREVQERQAAGLRFVSDNAFPAYGEAGCYLSQCVAALVDEDDHGGWPYRSYLVSHSDNRKRVLAALDTIRDPAMVQVVALGRIGPAVIDGDDSMLLGSLDALRASPWLAMRALNLAWNAAIMHERLEWLVGCVEASGSDHLTPAAAARLRWWKMHESWCLNLFTTDRPDILKMLPKMWSWHKAWRRQTEIGGKVSNRISSLLTDLGASPGFERAHLESLMWQSKLAAPPTLFYWQADAFAGAYARLGLMDDAVAWQRAAFLLVASAGYVDHKKREPLMNDYRRRQDAYRRGDVPLGHRPDGEPGEEEAAGGHQRGLLVGGKRCGVWKTSNQQGVVIEEAGYRSGDMAGPWIVRTAEGRMRWTGWVRRIRPMAPLR